MTDDDDRPILSTHSRLIDALNASRMSFIADLGPSHPAPRVIAMWSKQHQLYTYVVECPDGCGCEESE